jgi:hypothetical protein
MAIYQFRSSDGGVVERHFPMSKAPDIGYVITVKGKRFTRILSSGINLDASLPEKCRGYPMVSKAAPQGSGQGIPGISHTDKGEVVFASHTAKQEYCRAEGYTRDY